MKYKGEGKFIKRTGGVGSHGHCIINMYGLESGSGFEFNSTVNNNDIPKEYIPSIRKGIEEAAKEGYLAGYPMVDIGVELIGGSCHEVDSKADDFRQAAKLAFKDACSKADIVVLEPVSEIEVDMPKEHVGAVVGDLNRRRAVMTDVSDSTVKCVAPVAEMFGYATTLRSLTQGRANFVSTPSGYQEMPSNLQKELISK